MKKDKKQFNYNVVSIGLCFLMILFGLGLWAPKSLFVVPITSALGISRSAYSIADTMRYVATAFVNMFFGFLIQKFGSKKLICAGFLALIGAAVLYGVAEHVFVFYIGGFLLGVGLSWTGTTIVGYVVNKACKNNKGTIMGFVLAANGIGGALAAQIVTPFINDANNPFGYRKAYFVMAAVFATLFILLLIFYKEPVQTSENESVKSNKKKHGEGWVGIEYSQASKKAYFYGACVCILFTGMVLQGVTSISSAHMTDVGLDLQYISVIATISSLALSAFKFLNGFIYDRAGLRITITIDCCAAIGVMVCLYFITNSLFGMILAVVYAILAAIALPLETVMIPIYANDLFGEKSFNKVLGIFVSLNQIGYALGGPIINLFFDVTGTYKGALLLCGGIMTAVVIGLQIVITAAKKVRKSFLEEEPIQKQAD